MKIRTDFVTNSSSSSFISVVIETKDRKKHQTSFNSGDNSIDGMSAFERSKEHFEHMDSLADLLSDVKEWFDNTFEDPELPEECDYSNGSFADSCKLEFDDVKMIQISSEINIMDDFFEKSKIQYDCETHEYCCEKIGSDDFEIEDGVLTSYDAKLCSVDIEENIAPFLDQIGEGVFANHKELQCVYTGTDISKIGDGAFSGCSSLKEAHIGTQVSEIGEGAFDGCPNLVIYASEGSYAVNYAINNEIAYVLK